MAELWAEWSSDEEGGGEEEQIAGDKEVSHSVPGFNKKKKTQSFKRRQSKINNEAGLKRKRAAIKLGGKRGVEWVETLDIEWEGQHDDVDVDQDLERELQFYKQAKECVDQAIKKLRVAGVPYKRPEDYFAEMVKSDEHMDHIRTRLAKEKARIDRVDKKRRDKELRKFGKSKQREHLQERRKERRQEVEAIKQWQKKRKHGNATEADLEAILSNSQTKSKRKPSAKRAYKDSKYGYGGKRTKRNSAESTNDMSSFSSKRNKRSFSGTGGKRRK